MTDAQIQKFLELSGQIHDKIDALDVEAVVQAVTGVYNAQREAGKVIIDDNNDKPEDGGNG
jgi:hypothetical protein